MASPSSDPIKVSERQLARLLEKQMQLQLEMDFDGAAMYDHPIQAATKRIADLKVIVMCVPSLCFIFNCLGCTGCGWCMFSVAARVVTQVITNCQEAPGCEEGPRTREEAL